MTAPEIYRDEESDELDVFVPPAHTGALIEFLRGKVPYFGVMIEPSQAFEEDGEEVEEEEVEEDADIFSFPAELGEDELAALLEEFFASR